MRFRQLLIVLGGPVLLAMLLASPVLGRGPRARRARLGKLSGTIVLPAGARMPGDGLIVAFFDQAKGPPPPEAGLHRVPGMVVRSKPTGEFSVTLLPGEYHVGIMDRPRGVGPGPPRPGENFYFAMDGEGSLALFRVRAKEDNAAGRITVALPAEIHELVEFATVRGRVSDEEGRPFPGALVLVKVSSNVARPLFISAPSDKEGRYHIRLPPDTTYYLVARQSIKGGRPRVGAYVGTFGKTAPTQVQNGVKSTFDFWRPSRHPSCFAESFYRIQSSILSAVQNRFLSITPDFLIPARSRRFLL